MVKTWWCVPPVGGWNVGGPCGRSERNPRSGRSGPPPATAWTLVASATVEVTRKQPRFGTAVALRVLSG
jgi:hypothetical protein